MVVYLQGFSGRYVWPLCAAGRLKAVLGHELQAI
ncbi:MAG: hypothetical protein ACI87C_000174 [Paraperlucidibaca sp.]|jgi:hypothetical protein